MRIISEALARKIRSHACWFADLDEVTVPSAAVDDEQCAAWGDELYERALADEQKPRTGEVA